MKTRSRAAARSRVPAGQVNWTIRRGHGTQPAHRRGQGHLQSQRGSRHQPRNLWHRKSAPKDDQSCRAGKVLSRLLDLWGRKSLRGMQALWPESNLITTHSQPLHRRITFSAVGKVRDCRPTSRSHHPKRTHSASNLETSQAHQSRPLSKPVHRQTLKVAREHQSVHLHRYLKAKMRKAVLSFQVARMAQEQAQKQEASNQRAPWDWSTRLLPRIATH